MIYIVIILQVYQCIHCTVHNNVKCVYINNNGHFRSLTRAKYYIVYDVVPLILCVHTVHFMLYTLSIYLSLSLCVSLSLSLSLSLFLSLSLSLSLSFSLSLSLSLSLYISLSLSLSLSLSFSLSISLSVSLFLSLSLSLSLYLTAVVMRDWVPYTRYRYTEVHCLTMRGKGGASSTNRYVRDRI